ncbi:MAG: lytic transglycosylase domain-containing protein [Lachnospira sp.]
MNFVEHINLLDGNKYLVANTVSDNSDKVTVNFNDYLKKNSQDIKYEDIFNQVSAQTGVSAQLLKAVAQAESGCRSDAVSSCGAVGVMQLMPATAKAYGVTDPFDAYENISGGAKLLSDLLEKYNGNVTLSLAAYNAGSGNVSKYGGVPPFKETINYIDKINKLLSNALDNDSTTIEGAQPTQGIFISDADDSVDWPDIQLSQNILEKSLQLSAKSDNFSYNELLLKRIYETIMAVDAEDQNKTGNTDVINGVVTAEEISYNNNTQTSADNYIDASWVSSFVMPATAHAIDSIIKSSPQSLYEAQAYAVSPLIAQLKDI